MANSAAEATNSLTVWLASTAALWMDRKSLRDTRAVTTQFFKFFNLPRIHLVYHTPRSVGGTSGGGNNSPETGRRRRRPQGETARLAAFPPGYPASRAGLFGSPASPGPTFEAASLSPGRSPFQDVERLGRRPQARQKLWEGFSQAQMRGTIFEAVIQAGAGCRRSTSRWR